MGPFFPFQFLYLLSLLFTIPVFPLFPFISKVPTTTIPRHQNAHEVIDDEVKKGGRHGSSYLVIGRHPGFRFYHFIKRAVWAAPGLGNAPERIVSSLFFFLGSAQTLFPTLASLFFFLHAALFAPCPVRFLFHGRPVLLKGTRHGGLITDRRIRRGSSAVGVLRAGVSPVLVGWLLLS